MTQRPDATINIWDLPIGGAGEANGARYVVLRDIEEVRPGLGKVPVRVTRNQDGAICKFIRGIDVVAVGEAKTECDK